MSEGRMWDKRHIIEGFRLNGVYKQTLGTRAWGFTSSNRSPFLPSLWSPQALMGTVT